MKEPTDHYEVENEWSDEVCAEDGKPWPCKTRRKWEKSPEYRLQLLESSRRVQVGETLRRGKEVRELSDQVHRLKTFIDGLWPVIGDLLKGQTGGELSVGEHADYQDVSGFNGRIIARIETLRELNVDYTSPSGDTYRNGTWISGEYRKK